MPFIEVPNTCELAMTYSVAGETVVNVLGFTADGVWDETALGQLANGALDAWDELIQPTQSGNVTLVKAVATSLESESAPQVTAFAPGGSTGSGGSSYLPLNQALIIRFYTALRGRSYRGRLYHYGMQRDNLLDADNWSPTPAAAVATAYASFMEAVEGEVTGIEASHCIISRFADGAPRTTGIATPVVSYAYNPKVGTVRRRIG